MHENVRDIHLNEKDASIVKELMMSPFGNTILLGRMWVCGMMDNSKVSTKKAM